MTRNYVLSLVQQFNGSCEPVPEVFAIMGYGAYYEWKANTGILTAGAKMEIKRLFSQMREVLHRVHPHMLPEGHEDAETFLKLHQELDQCYTTPVEHLYNNIAELALERQNIPPDVDDDQRFLSMLSPQARANYRDGIPLPNHPSIAQQQELRRVKQSCLEFTHGAVTEPESLCRCHADALWQGHVNDNDFGALAARFKNEALTALSKRYPEYDTRKKACYH
jgi:hypothetical protein